METSGRLVGRLMDRREEIEQALLIRICSVGDPGEVEDPEYVDGLGETAKSVFDYALRILAVEPDQEDLVPPVLLSQARLAARNRVSLATVLRRYAAGQALCFDFLLDEAEREGEVAIPEFRRILAEGAAGFDRLMEAVSVEHTREVENRLRNSRERRRIERVERLLAGELVGTEELDYELGGWQTALLAESGSSQGANLRKVARTLERRLLQVRLDDRISWAWFGGRSKLESRRVLDLARAYLPEDAVIAVGEPGHGLSGWRSSHRQAKAALQIARRTPEGAATYADVGVMATVLRDQLLLQSLRRTYLDPLREEAVSGKALTEILDAYLTTGQNISSTAAALGVSRQTVRTRLKKIEEKLGMTIDTCIVEVGLALKVEQLVGLPPRVDQHEWRGCGHQLPI